MQREGIFIKRSTKIFLKSFVCAALVFAIVSSFFILSQTDTNASGNSSYSSSNSRFIPKQTDKFNLLLTISQAPGTAHAYFLLGFDAAGGKVRVLRLPEVCILSEKDESKIILKECFEKGGQAAAAKAISQFFNIKVSRYVSFTNESFISFIDSFEPTAIYINENLSQVDRKNDIFIKIDEGRRLISGSLMLDIFAYTKYKGGAAARFYESSRALSEFLSQNGAQLDKAQDLILKNAATNLSVLDFESRRECLDYLFSQTVDFESVRIYGESQLEGTQFTLTLSSKTKISALF